VEDYPTSRSILARETKETAGTIHVLQRPGSSDQEPWKERARRGIKPKHSIFWYTRPAEWVEILSR